MLSCVALSGFIGACATAAANRATLISALVSSCEIGDGLLAFAFGVLLVRVRISFFLSLLTRPGCATSVASSSLLIFVDALGHILLCEAP